MDLKYIEENNLNEARNRFLQINEYILKMNGENEAEQDNSEQPQDADTQQPPMNNIPQQQPQQQPSQDVAGQEPMQGGEEDIPQTGEEGMPQDDLSIDPTIGAEAGMDDGAGNMNDDDMTMTEPSMGDDEVIDVDDLTQSQETTEYKIDGVDDKISQLIDLVSKFSQAIEDNDEKLNDLKREIEERNPSQQERLNIRSMSGSPYTVSPQDYWSDQNARNPQYNVIADNEVDPDKEEDVYTITDDDIKNFNKSEIEKSISDYPKNLKDLF